MRYLADSPEDYLAQVPSDRAEALTKLRTLMQENLPEGFYELMQYGMISYSVSRELYPGGYHVNPKEPLPFIALANQKNHIGLYHMGLDHFPEILAWFKEGYAASVPTKLDYGKSCIRLKNMNTIPYELIAELARKISPQDYIAAYEKSLEEARAKRKKNEPA